MDTKSVDRSKPMKTYFASPERSSSKELKEEIELVSQSPVMTGLLHSVNGLLAVLDENRQILAMNDSFMEMLGIDDPKKALGMRPGEALACIHAHDEPAGCGTTPFCSTCGAVISMVSSLTEDKPVEKICALSAKRGEKKADIVLQVRSHPLTIQGKRFLLLFVQDVTLQQQRASLERTFYHDVNNMLGLLVGASELLYQEASSQLAETIHRTSMRIRQEVAIQRCLSQNNANEYLPLWHTYTVAQIVDELRPVAEHHPSARNKRIVFTEEDGAAVVHTDLSLVIRVLLNMIINALEATDENGHIAFDVKKGDNQVIFEVWNDKAIPADVAMRVFQRNFSTKNQDGRGLGTYSMKLFGEQILGGLVSFFSSQNTGTVFRFTLPAA